MVRRLQEDSHTVKLTRKTDLDIGLRDRAGVAKFTASLIFVSIHPNGFNRSTQRTERRSDTIHLAISADLCRAVQKRLVSATGYNDRNVGHPGGVKRQSLAVLKPNRQLLG
ncbi:hypothetical protein CN933_05730 [Sinorhizobium sp. M4_45]|nr:hypothetical protein CN933_05730 [Sinorhizobium sp. M4_45]